MTNATAFLDTSVLYSAPIRDLFLELAASDVYQAKWSDMVIDEWIHALLHNRPDLTRKKSSRTRELMNAHVRDAIVSDFNHLISGLNLPDPSDRHVLATAIKSRATVIVTSNLKDFPLETTERWGIDVLHSDDFLTNLFRSSQPVFLSVMKRVRSRLITPPKLVDEYLEILHRQGVVATVREIIPFKQVL